MSGATARNPESASARSWWRQEYQDSGKPWQRTTSGPVPCSARRMRMPFVSTVRCVASVIVVSSREEGPRRFLNLQRRGVAQDRLGGAGEAAVGFVQDEARREPGPRRDVLT